MKFIYFHSLYGDLGRMKKIREIAISEKTDLVICGGDFWRYEYGWIDDYIKAIKEICGDKRKYLQTYGDQDTVLVNTKNNVAFFGSIVLNCVNDEIPTISGQRFVGIPYTIDKRFSLKHLYRYEPGFGHELTLGETKYPNNGSTLVQCPRTVFPTLKDELAISEIEKQIDRSTILITHNPPFVDGLVAKDMNLVNRGSKEIARIIDEKKPYMVLTGHTTNEMLEFDSSTAWCYSIDYKNGKKTNIFNPGRNYVLCVDIKKKEYLYERIKIQ